MSFDDDFDEENAPGLEEIAESGPGFFQSKKDIEEEKAKVDFTIPTIPNLVRTCIRPEDEKSVTIFEKGDWVEIRDIDLEWRMARIEKVEVRMRRFWNVAEAEREVSYFFHTEEGLVGRTIHPDDIRAPEEGLQAIFGKRPWLWLQYAYIRLEALFQFDKSSLADFDAMNIVETVESWWDEWIKDPRNGEFDASFNEKDERVRMLLKDHILTEFKLMERIRDDDETWDFSDDYITVYSYLAILGDGIFTVILTLIIQLSVPALLVVNTMDRGSESEGDNTSPEAVQDFPNNFCITNILDGDVQGFEYVEKLVLMLVILIYMLKVIPDTLYSFYNVSGLSGTTYARINSLRNLLYRKGKDSAWQWLGFKLDRWMNTAYLNFLYLGMLFILYLTENIIDIILNALAIDFIHEIDEKLANAAWWDRDFRWVTAGCIEMVIQNNLDTDVLPSSYKIYQKYNVCESKKEFVSDFGNKGVKDLTKARYDEADTTNDYIEAKLNDLPRIEQETIRRFGFFEQMISSCSWTKKGIFHSFEAYRVWSIWNVLIFKSSVPDSIDDGLDFVYTAKPMAEHNPAKKFIRRVGCDILTFREAGTNVRDSIYRKNCLGCLAHFIAGFVDWLTYSLPIVFPIAVFSSLVLYTGCK